MPRPGTRGAQRGKAAASARKKQIAESAPDVASSSEEEANDDFRNQNDRLDVEDGEAWSADEEENVSLVSGESSSSSLEDSADEDEEEEVPENWGKKSSSYFKDHQDSDEEEEDPLLEEAEAMRIQRLQASRVQSKDYALPGGFEEDEEEEDERVSKTLSKKRKSSKEDASSGASPEVDALLKDLRLKTAELKNVVEPCLRLLSSSSVSTPEGVTYLETKLHLLLSYVTCVAFYLTLRAEKGAQRAEAHPVIPQLIQLRAALEKLRPLDAKLKRQIEAIVSRGEVPTKGAERSGKSSKASSLSFRPNLDDLESGSGEEGMEEDEEEEDSDGEGKYRPKRMNVASSRSEEEEDTRTNAEKRLDRRALVRAGKSEMMQELRAELTGAPHEEREASGVKASHLALEKARSAYEQENYTRLLDTKEDRARRRQMTHDAASGGHAMERELSTFHDFSDAMDRLNPENDDVLDDLRGKSAPTRPLTEYVNDLSTAASSARRARVSGDQETLPKERVAPKPAVRRGRDEEPDAELSEALARNGDNKRVKKTSAQEHPYYEASRALQQAKTQRKAETYAFPERFAPARIEETKGPRVATREMIKNRGLTPHRSKTAKNPRAKLREKYETAVKARKGQVQAQRDTKEGEFYAGEKTGVRSNLVRSRLVPN